MYVLVVSRKCKKKKKLRSLFSVGLTIVDYSDKGHYLKTE